MITVIDSWFPASFRSNYTQNAFQFSFLPLLQTRGSLTRHMTINPCGYTSSFSKSPLGREMVTCAYDFSNLNKKNATLNVELTSECCSTTQKRKEVCLFQIVIDTRCSTDYR